MRIESPLDYQYSENPISRMPLSREINNPLRNTLFKRKSLKSQNIAASQIKEPNYFEKMYKQVKKKTYVNLFIRKLKQATILKQSVNHQLCEVFSQQSKINQLKTFKWPKNIQISFTILQIMLAIIVCIATSLCIVFPEISNSYLQIIMIILGIAQDFFSNFMLAHLISLVLILMASPEGSWLIQKNLIHCPWIQQYIWAYYWATTIMLTVGFGDIVPTNYKEALVMIFIETLTCILLAYNINSVGNIIKKITSYQQQKDADLKTLFQMEGKQFISEDIKHKITNYITHSAELKRNFNVQQQTKLLQKLPKSFYQQFKKQPTTHIFNSIPFFRNLTFEKLSELAIKIQKKLIHPQEIIVESGSIPEILIANYGRISMNMNRIGLQAHGKQVQSFRVKQNQYRILSIYFLINKPINYDIKCKDYWIIYSLSKKQLQNCLSSSTSSYQYYCMTKDKDRYNPSDQEINLCTVCNKKTHHTLFQCPKLHYMPIKNLIISKTLAYYPQKIVKSSSKFNIQRKYIKSSVNCLKIKTIVQQQYQQFNVITKLKNPIIINKRINKSRTRFSQSLNKNNNIEQIYIQNSLQKNSKVEKIDEVYKEIGEKLKIEILNKILQITKLEKELQLDLAHNYASYFHSFNANLLATKKRKKSKN